MGRKILKKIKNRDISPRRLNKVYNNYLGYPVPPLPIQHISQFDFQLFDFFKKSGFGHVEVLQLTDKVFQIWSKSDTLNFCLVPSFYLIATFENESIRLRLVNYVGKVLCDYKVGSDFRYFFVLNLL